ncbi:Xaa-Pro peptidase family protein [Sulfitobacter sp.]|uniref:M24 family metallopeptidase n=1 Tax=Sulfitobacter sp. TaxID=1903071 RepID=UPI00329741BB
MAPEPYRRRLALLRQAMHEADVGAYLCDHAEMLQWLTGYTVSDTFYRGCVVPLEGEPVWVLRRIDELPCKAATWLSDIRPYADEANAYDHMACALKEIGATRVGADFNSYGFTVHAWHSLSRRLPDVEFVDIAGSANLLRAVKDETELGKLAQACRIADGAMAAVAKGIGVGMRPRDASAIASNHYLTNGSDDYWVGPVSISRRAAQGGHDMGFLHTMLREDRLADGDILHVELVPRVGGYSARIMRSISVGTPDPQMITVMARLCALQDAQFAAMRPEAVARDVDAILRAPLLEEGLRSDFSNITGYQLGLYAKTPRSSDTSLSFHPAADWRLHEGQVFHMYATAQGLALSETVVVTPEGARRMTATPRRILIAAQDYRNETGDMA